MERADADLLAFCGRYGIGIGIGIPTEDPAMTQVIDLANEHRQLQRGGRPCPGCADSGNSGTDPGGGGRR
ncbi:hypothetical protein [Streptomyces sclerotialus]|uniref:hypothetical protein n=1 Tax=Streptomyces sclerotialus TaxID=1957 RepID=UPI0034A326A9